MGKKQQKVGYVYFVRMVDEARIKIGYTASLPTHRITKLAIEKATTLEVVGLLIGTTRRERELHQEFADLNIEGEWFRAGERLAKFVDGIEYKQEEGLQAIIGLQVDERGKMFR